jgi:hypothetical protein
MRFKEFIQISEEQSGTDKGLMGYPQPYFAATPSNNGGRRKPSDGLPFKNLTNNAGSNPRGGAAGGGAPAGAPQMMRKKMSKN